MYVLNLYHLEHSIIVDNFGQNFEKKILPGITANFCCNYSLFVFVALRPMSTAMVIAGRSVHLTTLFSWAGLSKRLTSNLCTYFRL